MSSEFAIRIRDVGKCFLIYARPEDRLKQAIIPRLKRLIAGEEAARSTRYFREFWALRDVSFDVPRGGTLGVIGRNGSGKSTLLQILCGTLTPSSGSVEVNGRVAALLELGSGFNPEFTGRENVFLNASILGLSEEKTRARYDAIVDFADIGDFIDQPVKTYSSGMALRLAFAVIAHVDADILVIDEALSVGDAFFTQKCMRFLRDFMRTGTILFVSHDSAAVLGLCDEAVWLDGGRLRMHDRAKLVCDSYLEALFAERQGPAGGDGPTNTATRPLAEPGQPAQCRPPAVAGSADTSSPPLPRSDARRQPVPSGRAGDPAPVRPVYQQALELFSFDPDAPGFGQGHARISEVELWGEDDSVLTHIEGAEIVTLRVRAHAASALKSPIIGFFIRDRLGQTLFGDNTYLWTLGEPKAVPSGGNLIARFRFQMPILPVGDYSLTVAIADGTQADHVQHHWLHDALIVRSHTSSVSQGLIGIPMLAVSLEVEPAGA